MSKVGQGSLALVKKTSSVTTSGLSATTSSVASGLKATKSGVSSLTELAVNKIAPPRINVVTVREKDLKPLPTAQERLAAYEKIRDRANQQVAQNHSRKKRSFLKFFDGPSDFKEADLPEPGAELDGMLLPPREP